jgi:hypothetical protein
MLLLVGSDAAPPFGKILKSITILLAVIQMIRIFTLIICKDPDPNQAPDPGSDPSINKQKK